MERILGHKYDGNEYHFLVKWKYFDESNNTYEPYDCFTQKELLNEYLAKNNIEI